MPGSNGLESIKVSNVIARVLAACLLTIGVITTAQAADVNFRWAIFADSGDGMRPLDFTSSPPIVFSGTGLQIYLEHLTNCHIYLYLLDSQDELTPLYPDEKGYYNYGFPRGPKFIPPGDQSFAFVPPPGNETFLLIASEERLFQIERLTEEFQNHSDSIGQQKLLISEIEAIITAREKKSWASESIKEAVRKIRTSKGLETKVFKAVEVDISKSYGRRILIDHQ
jgi:hypothetical protein